MNIGKKISLVVSLLLVAVLTVSYSLYSLTELVQAQTPPTNLITNGGFESGFTGWTAGSGATILTTDKVEGAQSAHLVGIQSAASVTKNITLATNTTYKVTMWLKINSITCQVQGSSQCWGYFHPILQNWNGLTGDTGTIDALDLNSRPASTWFKESFVFSTTNSASGQLFIGPYAGTDLKFDVEVDDVEIFVNPTTNIPPTVSISTSTPNPTSIPASVPFSSTFNDVDGSIKYFSWDFGDGGHSNVQNPTHTYVGNGTYNASLTVVDDAGASATASTQVTVNDPNYPTLTVSSPSQTNLTTTSPTVSISGTATGGAGTAIAKIQWSTDRDDRIGTATGTNNWSFTLDLTGYGGRNRILLDAYDTNGKVAHKDLIISYNPGNIVTVANGAAGVTQAKNSVEQYDKFEATFTLTGGMYSNPYFPYDTNTPVGMVSCRQ